LPSEHLIHRAADDPVADTAATVWPCGLTCPSVPDEPPPIKETSMTSRALTPTLIICGAVAIGGGIALARPASQPGPPASAAITTLTPTTTPGADTASRTGGGYGRRPTATTTPRASTSDGRAPDAVNSATLTISGFAFGPPLTVSPGATVSVRNLDSAPHTVTGATFDSGTVAGGSVGSFTAPTVAGTHRLTCEIHPSMTGSLTVR
jgi:plastocyanin